MFFEIILLSVIVTTAWVGPTVLRRSPSGNRTYGWLIVADLACAVIAFAARRSEGAGGPGDLLGAIAIGAAVFLLMVPPLLRGLARRAVMRDHLWLARWLIDLRELLQPGMGAREERELLDAFVAVRDGRVDDALAVLREARELATDPHAIQQLDERILITYVSARRWHDAIEYYERTLADPDQTSPQLLVELVRAYCETGELTRAAELVEWLEEAPLPDEPVVLFLRSRARMVFLAFAGRTGAVENIVGPGGPLARLAPTVRHYWSGVARLNAGDRKGAESSLTQAVKAARKSARARELAEAALASLDRPGVIGPHAIAQQVAEVADRVTTVAATEKPIATPVESALPWWRVAPVTSALVVANLLIAGALWLIYGSTGDPGALVRAGANVGIAVEAGQWWRLASSTFLHVGLIHLALNMWALWILGRMLEQMFGSARYFPLYVGAGLCGSLASATLGAAAFSAGASGAVLGVLGALVAELALRRGHYPERWRRAMLAPLVFITAAEIGIGFMYAAIDQAAHLGGLGAGAALAVVLSPAWSKAQTAPVRALVAVLIVASAASLGGAVWGVSTQSYADALTSEGWVEHRIGADAEPEGGGAVVVTAPAAWRVEDDQLVDWSGRITLWLRATPAAQSTEVEGDGEPSPGAVVATVALAAEVEARLREVKGKQGTATERPAHRTRALSPWLVRELDVAVDGLAGAQRYRFVLFARAAPQGEADAPATVWVGGMSAPSALAGDLAGILRDVLASARAD